MDDECLDYESSLDFEYRASKVLYIMIEGTAVPVYVFERNQTDVYE